MLPLKRISFTEFSAVGVIWSSFFSIGSFLLYLVSAAQPSVYIDEIFHAGQCQKYCEGNFLHYDPKITTPPGLYIITVAMLNPLSKFLQIDLCTLIMFRLFNFFVSQLNFILLYRIVNSQVQEFSTSKKLLISLNLSLLPVLYFYSFFYYTDVVSTFLVLLTYYFYRRNQSVKAGVAGLLSVTTRQTNIVWFFCFCFIKCCAIVDTEASKAGRTISKAQKRRISYPFVILKESLHFLRYSFCDFVTRILKETQFFIISSLCFIYFLSTNGGIVLGDKSAHQVVVHIPQLFYFSMFVYLWAFPSHISSSIKFLKNLERQKLRILITALIMSLIVFFNTMAHLYLVSDNRHYTFYIWKRIFEKRFGRYLVIPLYIVSMYSIEANIRHLDACAKLAFLVSTVICLIPQKLLELRYFIIPYLIYRIETCRKLTRWQICLELFLNVFVNYLTLFLFLYKPYTWPDGTIQRFSW